MASGRSAASVSRTGLPFSQVSATASISRLSSIRSAILLRMMARSVTEVRPQRAAAPCGGVERVNRATVGNAMLQVGCGALQQARSASSFAAVAAARGRSGDDAGSTAHSRCHISRSSAPQRDLVQLTRNSGWPEARIAARSARSRSPRSSTTPGASLRGSSGPRYSRRASARSPAASCADTAAQSDVTSQVSRYGREESSWLPSRARSLTSSARSVLEDQVVGIEQVC